MKEIPLTRGFVAWVSDHRYAELNQHKWFAVWNSRKKSYVAARNVRVSSGRGGQRQLHMHREILGLIFGDPRQGDHRNQNGLDNTDENLRIATHAEQQHNRRAFHNNSTGFKGVWPHAGKFQAKIISNGTRRHLGTFSTPELAHAAYCRAALELHGEFARLA